MDRVNHSRVIRFGVFEVDLHSKELFNHGHKIRMEGQPFQVLSMLLKRPGALISRKELQRRLWPGDTFVDFDHSLNVAIKRLREALYDSADTPRYIETLPRRGYRFIYPVQGSSSGKGVLADHSRFQKAVGNSSPANSSLAEASLHPPPASVMGAAAQPTQRKQAGSSLNPSNKPALRSPAEKTGEVRSSGWLNWEAGLIGSLFVAGGLLLWKGRHQ